MTALVFLVWAAACLCACRSAAARLLHPSPPPPCCCVVVAAAAAAMLLGHPVGPAARPPVTPAGRRRRPRRAPSPLRVCCAGVRAKTQDEIRAESFTPAPLTTPADEAGDTKSLSRALAKRLYLVVRRTPGGGWAFPQRLTGDGETMRQVRGGGGAGCTTAGRRGGGGMGGAVARRPLWWCAVRPCRERSKGGGGGSRRRDGGVALWGGRRLRPRLSVPGCDTHTVMGVEAVCLGLLRWSPRGPVPSGD